MLAVLRKKVEFMPEGIAVLFVLIGLILIISCSLNLPTRTESDWIKYDKAVPDEKDKTTKVTVTYGNKTRDFYLYQRASVLNDDPLKTVPGKDGNPVPKGTIQIEFNPNDKSDYDLFGITPAGRWEIMWGFISIGIIFTVFGLFVITVDELDKYTNKKPIQ